MFTEFFLCLRNNGLPVSLTEWLTLMEALKKELHRNSLSGFYFLCRAILCRSEKDYDVFDSCFLTYFQGAGEGNAELSRELLSWLMHPDFTPDERKLLRGDNPIADDEQRERIRSDLQDRLNRQDAEHNRGKIWIGTSGYSAFGNRGWVSAGIRVGGKGQHRRAFDIAGERTFRDFRHDNVLDPRQFQMAFRILRQYSVHESNTSLVFDVDGTIQATAKQGGKLKICYQPPRKNTIKLLLLMDSGGSMAPYASLCAALFQAVKTSNHFKAMQIYYFHNCIKNHVFSEPSIAYPSRCETGSLLKKLDADYRVIIVGDALMDYDELLSHPINWHTHENLPNSIEWMEKIKRRFVHTVWLNPVITPPKSPYWGASYHQIASQFDMFPLTIAGLSSALKHLL